MSSKQLLRSALGMLLLSLGSPARAWGPVGHKAVAMIAESRLSPQALQAIEDILGPGARLDIISSCADKFIYEKDRSCAGLFTMQGESAPTKPWHFIDIPVNVDIPHDARPSETPMMDFCPGGSDCVVAQIRREATLLGEPGAAPDDKRMALMFLVHFIGDVHQPMHGATDEPDDHGGNLKAMRAILHLGRPVNLHSIWDAAIDDPAKVDYRLPDETLTSEARALAASLAGDISDQDATAWTKDEDLAGRAALESHFIAQTVIYPAYKASQGRDLLKDYQDKMQPLAHRRIEMAGVRLAALLERALGAVASPR